LRAVLLAAGLGTRLKPVTNKIPKCLVSINGKPLLQYWMELLFGNDISQVLINTHYMADAVHSYVSQTPWYDRITLFHEEVLLGTGGTLLANKEWLSDEFFLVAHADNLTDFDVNLFKLHHINRPPDMYITMMTFQTDMPSTCGIVEVDEKGIVKAFHEKVSNPPGNQANAAVYIMEPEVLEFLMGIGKPKIDLSTEVIPHYIGKIVTYPNTHYHRDIGTLESLRKAEKEFSGLLQESAQKVTY